MKLSFVVIAISIFCFGCSSGFMPLKLQGTAMRPGFNDGDRILFRTNPGQLFRGDVIALKYPKDPSVFYIKRVIGLPGETVSILDGIVSIDGLELNEPYVDQVFNQSGASFSPLKVPDKSYFILDDNRDNSSDSRYWGTVHDELIVGRHFWTYLRGK